MVIALFALSLVMIVGGIAAVVQGFPYVRLESGLAMVIGGTTAASAGVVLLGLGAAVMQLKRLEGLFAERRADGSDQLVQDPRVSVPPPVDEIRGPTMGIDPPVAAVARPSLSGTAGLAGLTLGAVTGKDDLDARHAIGNEPALSSFMPPDEPSVAGPDEDLFAHPEDRPGHVSTAIVPAVSEASDTARHDGQEELTLRPALDEPVAARGESSPEAPSPAPAEVDVAKPERQAVGSYASGGNTYVMYSDGTIDADTPRGRFTFQSLDELKEFVASGEAGERGAA